MVLFSKRTIEYLDLVLEETDDVEGEDYFCQDWFGIF